jgi:hypothetical protein
MEQKHVREKTGGGSTDLLHRILTTVSLNQPRSRSVRSGKENLRTLFEHYEDLPPHRTLDIESSVGGHHAILAEEKGPK